MTINKKLFKLFKKECKYWLNRFDLGSWRVDIYQGAPPDDNLGRKILAWCDANWVMRTCVIGLQNKVSKNSDIRRKIIAMAAFHEVCELLLHTLKIMAEMDAKPTILDEVTSSVHAIIRRMEKAIWEPYWNRKYSQRTK